MLEQLLSPSPQRPHAPLNIHTVLERVLRLAENEGGWSVRLQRDYDPSLPELSGDADRLTQAVWNLVRNALQAGAANIILRTRVEHGARIHDHLHAMALRVEIVDDGRGVPEALAEHLFLPLVSGRAEGSGLGLALSQQVAREHRGSLTYRSWWISTRSSASPAETTATTTSSPPRATASSARKELCGYGCAHAQDLSRGDLLPCGGDDGLCRVTRICGLHGAARV